MTKRDKAVAEENPATWSVRKEHFRFHCETSYLLRVQRSMYTNTRNIPPPKCRVVFKNRLLPGRVLTRNDAITAFNQTQLFAITLEMTSADQLQCAAD